MKKLLKVTLILSCYFLLFSCEDGSDKVSQSKGVVSFNFNDVVADKVGARNTTDYAAILISIEDEAGTALHQRKELELYNFNGKFLSETISLPLGNYKVTEFLVLDALGEVVLVTPVVGAELAYLVDNPLPVDFTISQDQITELNLEVIAVSDQEPEAFGYSAFTFEEVAYFPFQMMAYILDDSTQSYALTTAALKVSSINEEILFEGPIQDSTTLINVNAGYTDYILEVTKEGCITYTDTISELTLRDAFTSPVQVFLATQSRFLEELEEDYRVTLQHGSFPSPWENPNVFITADNAPDGNDINDPVYDPVDRNKIEKDTPYYMVADVQNLSSEPLNVIVEYQVFRPSNGIKPGNGILTERVVGNRAISPGETSQVISSIPFTIDVTGHFCIVAWILTAIPQDGIIYPTSYPLFSNGDIAVNSQLIAVQEIEVVE